MEQSKLKQIIEAALMAAGSALKLDHIMNLFEGEQDVPSRDEVLQAIHSLMADCEGRGVELVEVASGFRFQARQEFSNWVQRLWEEKPQRYSRALLETLALIAYRQPITRAEIEEVRGVSVSSTIIKTLQEREWVRVVGHRDVPGKPAMYATTREFLDYFNMQSLDELPTLAEIRDIDSINAELAFDEGEQSEEAKAADGEGSQLEANVEEEPPVAEPFEPVEQQETVIGAAVSDTHLTLPTKREVSICVLASTLTKKQN
ncbi:MAG: SMC-Scp complex subunit ScpB [Gammaproteobacteria bacterium]|nr:SMC-Scp complex subunit ScpB [Gammaproteobacteria bacterium]